MSHTDGPLSEPASLAALGEDPRKMAEDFADAGDWRVHCAAAHESITGLASRHAATEAACRLMDNGVMVVGIGKGRPDEDAIGRDQLALTYGVWTRVKYG